ncbi:hypothetical protein ISCGN_000433 [Ixodes scapularis]
MDVSSRVLGKRFQRRVGRSEARGVGTQQARGRGPSAEPRRVPPRAWRRFPVVLGGLVGSPGSAAWRLPGPTCAAAATQPAIDIERRERGQTGPRRNHRGPCRRARARGVVAAAGGLAPGATRPMGRRVDVGRPPVEPAPGSRGGGGGAWWRPARRARRPRGRPGDSAAARTFVCPILGRGRSCLPGLHRGATSGPCPGGSGRRYGRPKPRCCGSMVAAAPLAAQMDPGDPAARSSPMSARAKDFSIDALIAGSRRPPRPDSANDFSDGDAPPDADPAGEWPRRAPPPVEPPSECSSLGPAVCPSLAPDTRVPSETFAQIGYANLLFF